MCVDVRVWVCLYICILINLCNPVPTHFSVNGSKISEAKRGLISKCFPASVQKVQWRYLWNCWFTRVGGSHQSNESSFPWICWTNKMSEYFRSLKFFLLHQFSILFHLYFLLISLLIRLLIYYLSLIFLFLLFVFPRPFDVGKIDIGNFFISKVILVIASQVITWRILSKLALLAMLMVVLEVILLVLVLLVLLVLVVLKVNEFRPHVSGSMVGVHSEWISGLNWTRMNT